MTEVEYQRFGPWVLEINDRDTIPEIFQPHVKPIGTPLLSVKIPRPVERAKAKHLTHLYDFLISLYADRLTILHRHGDSVTTDAVPYGQIEYLYSVHDLLYGCVHIATSTRVYEIPYSTVSSDLMCRVIDLVRRFYAESDRTLSVEQADHAGGESLSIYFSNLLDDELSRNPDLRVLASQVETPIADHETSRPRRFVARVTGRRLLESLHLTDGRELVIINRGQTYRHGKQAVYARHTLYLPLSRIRSAEWRRPTGESPLTDLVLRTTQSVFTHRFLVNNRWRDHYKSFLRNVAGR